MADVHNKKTRSFNMSRIRGKDTGPEILVRKFLFEQGFRYKLHDKMLPGKPDLVFPKYKTVVFIHGCFWHEHEGCNYVADILTCHECGCTRARHCCALLNDGTVS